MNIRNRIYIFYIIPKEVHIHTEIGIICVLVLISRQIINGILAACGNTGCNAFYIHFIKYSIKIPDCQTLICDGADDIENSLDIYWKIIYLKTSQGGNMSMDYKTLERKAKILKAIAHPVRLAILKGLMKNGPTRVMDMETGIKVNPATVSQHLNKLKSVNIVTKERKGVETYYSIRNVEGAATMLDVFLIH